MMYEGAKFLEAALGGKDFPFDEVQTCAQSVSALALIELANVTDEQNTVLRETNDLLRELISTIKAK